MIDKIKCMFALAILIAGVVLFYKLPALMQVAEVSILLRVGVVIVSAIIALILFLITDSGKRLMAFLKGAQIEVKKMIWPSKNETSQTTFIVFVAVLVIGLFLWLIDLGVVNVVYDMLLGIDT